MYSGISHWFIARFPKPESLIFYTWLQGASTRGQLWTLKCQEGSSKLSGHPMVGGQVQPSRQVPAPVTPDSVLCLSLPIFALCVLPLSEISVLHTPEDKNQLHSKAKELPPPAIFNYFTFMGRVNWIWKSQKYFVLFISSGISKILKKPNPNQTNTFTRFLCSIKQSA